MAFAIYTTPKSYLGVRNLNRKIISITLVLCMLLSSIAVGGVVTNAASDEAETVSAASGSQGA